MQTALELTGTFAFATSGALLAIRRDFDVVGIAILAVATALGGGIVRDLLVVPLATAAVALAAHPELERLTRTLLVFDAAGLGLFCVTGTVKALEYGLAPVAAAALGTTTAVAIAWELDAYDPAVGAVAAAAMFGVRCLALHRHWRGPRAWRR